MLYVTILVLNRVLSRIDVTINRNFITRLHIRVVHLGSLSLKYGLLLVVLRKVMLLISLFLGARWILALSSLSVPILDVVRVSEHIDGLAPLGCIVKYAYFG